MGLKSTQCGENSMIVLSRHRRMSHDPAIYVPIGHRQESFEKIELMGVE